MGVRIHAPLGPTFDAIRNKLTRELRSSTVDFVFSRDPVDGPNKIESYAASCSEHYPAEFRIYMAVERASRQRRTTKTLLQSENLAETASIFYAEVLRQAETQLDSVGVTETVNTQAAKTYFYSMNRTIRWPWLAKASKLRRYTLLHWNQKFLKLLARKKIFYKQLRWKPNGSNARSYKEAYRKTQRYERQLERERKRKDIQRIQSDPGSAMEVALRKQKDMGKHQVALENLTGAQLAPRAYANYMQEKLDLLVAGDVVVEAFAVDETETAKRIYVAIIGMDRNQAAGTDQIHVEMLMVDAQRLAPTLIKCWNIVGRSRIIPPGWLEGTIVPNRLLYIVYTRGRGR